jgi:hypothetical protein
MPKESIFFQEYLVKKPMILGPGGNMNRTDRSPLDETMMNMTWIEVEEVAKRSNLVLLPVGTIEAHGPHLPLGSDTYGALELARICRRLLERRGML